MRVQLEKFDGTFVVGISYSRFISKYTDKPKTNLIFDLGKFAIAFLFGKEK